VDSGDEPGLDLSASPRLTLPMERTA
jgi:hypothetical protein